jgi:hypothetical protein
VDGLILRRSQTYGYENPALRAVRQIEPISDQYYPIHFQLLLVIQTLPFSYFLSAEIQSVWFMLLIS